SPSGGAPCLSKFRTRPVLLLGARPLKQYFVNRYRRSFRGIVFFLSLVFALPPLSLLCRLRFSLRVGEALGFFAASCPFPHVISAVTMSHKIDNRAARSTSQQRRWNVARPTRCILLRTFQHLPSSRTVADRNNEMFSDQFLIVREQRNMIPRIVLRLRTCIFSKSVTACARGSVGKIDDFFFR